MKIIAISDTHDKFHLMAPIPDGDVLIHAGDLTTSGGISSLAKAAEWLRKQPHKYKVMISGNHDWAFANANHDVAVQLFKDAGMIYLQDNETVIEGIKFYGAPWQPWYHDFAFNLPRGSVIAAKWKNIPDDTNVLITHGPPYGILDLVEDNIFNMGRDLHQGCEDLINRIKQLDKLKAHIFGHLHLSGGKIEVINNVIFGNAAICTERYVPSNPPLVFEV